MLADGLEDLLAANYEAVETDTDTFPLDVDWPAAFTMERQGLFKAISVRRDGVLVGYAAFHTTAHFHSCRARTAFCDVIYAPGRTAALVRTAETLLKGLGVKRIFYAVKLHDPALLRFGDLLDRLEYKPYELMRAKIL